MPLPKIPITVTRKADSSLEGYEPSETITTLISGNRRFVVVPTGKAYDIFGERGLNGKAKYVLYTEKGDARLIAGDIIDAILATGDKVKAVVTMPQIMNQNIMNRQAEYYCESLDM